MPISTIQNVSLASGVPGYANLPTGSVLQVVQGNTNVQFTTSSSTPASIGLTASITPKFSTSKILVLVSVNGIFVSAVSAGFANTYLYRGAGNIANFGYVVGYLDSTAGNSSNRGAALSASFVDAPGTTATTTYTVYGSQTNGSTVNFQRDSSAFSTMILMEIAG